MATRRERVVLDLEDNFSGPMARPAAAAALLNKELQSLDKNSAKTGQNLDKNAKGADAFGKSLSGLNTQIADANRSTDGLADRALPRLGKQSETTGKQIDRMSGRLQLFAEAALVLGPALVPIGAAVVPALSAMAMGMTVAAASAAVAVMAFNGVGSSLKALDAAQLEPTTANMEKLRAEFDKIGPAGTQFVRFLDSLEPQLRTLSDAAREGLLPGVEAGIRELMTTLPQARELISGIAVELGNLAESSGQGLSGEGFEAFFNYLRTDAAPTLNDFGQTIGNVAEGIANMMVAFAPLTRDFTGGMESMTASFAEWAAGLSQSDGFQGFVGYIQSTGPMVLDLLGSLSNAFVAIITAAAPLGQALLPALSGLADVITLIAGSSIGPALFTAAAGLVAWNRACILAGPAAASLKVGMAGIATAAAPLAAILGAGMFVGFLDGLDDAHASLQQMDADLAGLAAGDVSERLNSLSTTANGLGEALTEAAWNDLHIFDAADEIKELDASLATLASRDPKAAARSFAEIAAQGKVAGLTTEELAGIFPQYTDAAYLAAKAADRAAGATRGAGRAAGMTKTQITGLMNAMKEQRREALAGFDATTAWGQALADARKQARSGAKGIDEMTKGGRENRAVLSNLAATWNANSDAVKNNIGKFAEARDAFIRTATAMDVPRRAAQRLADDLMDIPRSVVTNVTVATGSALSALAEARRQLAAMNGLTATMYLTTVRSGPGGIGDNGYRAADGATVPRTGRPYADRHPYLLADGEEVISNRYGQADKHRALLKAINSNRLADGGTAARYAAAARSNYTGGSTVTERIIERPAASGSSGPAVIKVYDVDGKLMGSMRGEIDADRSYQRTLGRQGVR